MRVLLLTDAEWEAVAPLLPPTGGPGRPRQDDKVFMSAFAYAAACGCSLDALEGYGNPRSLRTRWQRWQQAGIAAKLMAAAAPAIKRMQADYWQLVRDAPINWDNSAEFFGTAVPKPRHLQPRGRYGRR
jgi:transposase